MKKLFRRYSEPNLSSPPLRETDKGANTMITDGEETPGEHKNDIASLIVEDCSLDDEDMVNLIIYEREQEVKVREAKLEKYDQLVEEVKHQRSARRKEQEESRKDFQTMKTLFSLLGGQREFGGISDLEQEITRRLDDFNKAQKIKSDLQERFRTLDVKKIFEKQAKMTLKIKSLKEELQQSTADEHLRTMCDRLRNEISELSVSYDEFQNNLDWQDIENIKRVCANLGRHENDPRLLSQFLETKLAEMNDERIALNEMKKHMEQFCGQTFQSANELNRILCRLERPSEFTGLVPVDEDEEDDEVPARQLSKSRKFRQKLSPQNELSQIRNIMANFLSERCRRSDHIFFEDKETPFYRQFESALKMINPQEDWALELIRELKSERDDLLNVLTDYKGGVNLNSQFKTPKEIAEKLNDMKTNAIAHCFDVFEDELEEKNDANVAQFLFHLISEYYHFTIQRKSKLFEDLRDNYCAPHIRKEFLVGGLSRVIRDCYEPKDQQFLDERGHRFGELVEHMRNGGLLSEIVKECGVVSFLVVWSRNPRLELYPIGDEEREECRGFDPSKYEELFSTAKRTENDQVGQVVFPGLFEESDERREMPSSKICVLIEE